MTPSSNSVVRYVIMGMETAPSTGSVHLQGYTELNKATTWSALTTLVPALANCFNTVANGTSDENFIYCSKDKEYVEWGKRTKQGRRSDLEDVKDAMDENMPIAQVADAFFGTFLRYSRSLISYRGMIVRQQEYQKPKVIVRWGIPGSGKTRFIYDNHKPEDIWCWAGGSWFDAYDGHPVVLFDDFDGSCLGFRTLLRLLDRYPIDVPVKGAYVPWRPKIIYLTSNLKPEEWYPQHEAHLGAIKRRIDECIEVIGAPDPMWEGKMEF